MRIALAALLWLVLVGGLLAFLAATTPPEPAAPPAPPPAAGAYTVELTASFPLEPDPFALEGAALLLLLHGRTLARESGPRPAGEPLRLEAQGLQAGANEFFLRASPPLAESGRAHAVRLVLRKGVQSVAERSFWSEPGGVLAGSLEVRLPGESAEERP